MISDTMKQVRHYHLQKEMIFIETITIFRRFILVILAILLLLVFVM